MSACDARALRDLCAEHSDCYRTPALNDRLYLSGRGFTELGGLEAYTGLRALFADGNALRSLKGLPRAVALPGAKGGDEDGDGCEKSTGGGLPHLRCLYVQNNCLTSLEGLYCPSEGGVEEKQDDGGGDKSDDADAPAPAPVATCCAPNLEKLNVSANRLTSLEGVQHFPRLSHLEAAGNDLASVEAVLGPLRALRRAALGKKNANENAAKKDEEKPGDNGPENNSGLSTLDLSDNGLADPSLIDLLPRACPGLRVLYLRGNPCVSSCGGGYRRRVIASFPLLSYLDDRPVFPEERRLAEAWVRGGLEAEREERVKAQRDREARDGASLEFMRRLRGAGQRERAAMLGIGAFGGGGGGGGGEEMEEDKKGEEVEAEEKNEESHEAEMTADGAAAPTCSDEAAAAAPTARQLDDARAYFDDLRARGRQIATTKHDTDDEDDWLATTPPAAPPPLAPPPMLREARRASADDADGHNGSSAAALAARLRSRRVARALDFSGAGSLPLSFSAALAAAPPAAAEADTDASGAMADA